MNSPREQIIQIANKHNLSVVKVADAARLLGHTNEEKIVAYLEQRGWAIVRMVSDGKGGFRRMTEEEFLAKFK